MAPGLTNAILTGPLTAPLVKLIAGVARERQLPRLAAKSFLKQRNEHQKLGAPGPGSPRTGPRSRGGDPSHLGTGEEKKDVVRPVLLWPDTWNNYYHPQALSGAESVLSSAGFAVETPRRHLCCGRPLYDFGLLSAARSYLARVLDEMTAQIEAGLPFVFLEPSCASVFRDELLELFPTDPRARRLSRQVWLLADFLAAERPGFAAPRLDGKRILVHGHCHHKAVFGGAGNEIALLRSTGAEVELIRAGCCGMAGPFGFEADKFGVSRIIANHELLPAVQAAGPEVIVVADGFSCREQIEQLGHRRAVHFAEVLAQGAGSAVSDR
jgi:Fe-S oxidoreductase